MLKMEQTEAAMYKKMNEKLNDTQRERTEGFTTDKGQRELILDWFVETQEALILSDGSFPPWFYGFISRQEAEDQLKDKNIGCFLIRLSEKAIGYILSYKGQDRCRHFVINQTNTGRFVISGDSTTHNSLIELIDHFKTTPIQPFGEYLISYNPETNSVGEDELYDVVQNKPIVNAGVSVKALRSLWEPTSNVPHSTPTALPSKSGRKLTISTSIDRNSLSQGMKISSVPKKNTPLRNSLSAGLPGTYPSFEQHSLSEPRIPGRSGGDEGVNSRRSDSTNTEDDNGQSGWPPQHENNQQSPNYSELMLPISQQPPLLPPKAASCSYSVLERKKMPHTGQIDLESNPLYQASSGAYAGLEDQLGPEYDNRANPGDNILLAENTYQDIPEQRDNNTYEHIPMSNTYEDIRVTDRNMYASVDEMQTPTQNILGKKNHKWWKLRLENKK